MNNYLKVSEVAKRLSCDRKVIYRLIASGELEAFNVSTGKQRPNTRISEDALAAFLAKRKVA